jgi:hypothetical protein
MKLWFTLAAFALAFAALSAQAQNGGLYLNPIVTHITGTADTGPYAFLGSGSTSQTFGGVDFGGYYDFLHSGKSTLGIDLRDEIEHGNNASLNSFLVGIRLSYHPTDSRWRPYLQPAFGEGRSKSPQSIVHKTKLEVAISAGADYAISKHIDFRAIEIGYGSVGTISSTQVGTPGNIPAVKLLNFSTGLVFRIP